MQPRHSFPPGVASLLGLIQAETLLQRGPSRGWAEAGNGAAGARNVRFGATARKDLGGPASATLFCRPQGFPLAFAGSWGPKCVWGGTLA